MTQTNTIDLDLVDQIIQHIPMHTWEFVKSSVIEYFVDNMTSDVLTKLTGEPDAFEKAEGIFHDYYDMPAMSNELIVDLVKIAGIDNTVNFLDRLQLDKMEPGDCA
jgi:hypothetical protein